MYRSVRFCLALAVAVAVLVTAPAARAGGGVSVQLTANRITKSQGREVLSSAAQAHPGETLEYRATYRNDGDGEARGLAATLPIPAGTSYVPGSASPRRVEASLDGRTFAPVPLTRKVRTADGRTVVREVPVSEYRALRWPLGSLPKSQSRAVTARVRIEPTEVAALTR
jgi:uncharacterized repeat protein (TIGR01451 family)